MEKNVGFELKVEMDDLRKRKLFVSVPMYGGQCHGIFSRSIADLSALCAKYGIGLTIYYLFNESLVQRARNYAVDEFVRSDCDHMLFIDSDIGFDPNDAIALMAIQQSDPEKYGVIAAPYAKKNISWEKIKAAVDKGLADENPNDLEKFVGDYVFNPKSGATSIRLDEPVQVMETGTGFMMFTKDLLAKFREAYPEKAYKPDHVRSENFDGSREIHAYFDCVIDPETKRYLSEDYYFCQQVNKMGSSVWLCPWMKLQHAGSYIFGGSLIDLATAGVAATADPTQIKKKSPK
jgi:hypothetical protein